MNACINSRKIIFYAMLLFMPACMKMTGEVPSRLSIINADRQELEDVTLLPGMSYKVYSGVYVGTKDGEIYRGAANQVDFLGKVKFEISGESALESPISIDSQGCVLARKEGEAPIHLTAYSLEAGQLESTSHVHVVPFSKTARLIKSQVKDFSVSEIKTSQSRVYGVVLNDHMYLFDVSGQNLMTSAEGILLEPDNLTAKDSLGVPIIWSDIMDGGFFIAYRKTKEGKQNLSYTAIQRNGVGWPAPFDFELEVAIQRLFGAQFHNGSPLLLAVIQNKDKDEKLSTYGFYAVSQQLLQLSKGVDPASQQGFITDAGDQGKEVELPASIDVDRSLQSAQDQQGTVMIAYGASLVHSNPKKLDETTEVKRLKFVRVEGAQTNVVSSVEAPQGMNLDDPSGFSLDVKSGNPRVIFIQNGRLLFSQRFAGGWTLSFREVGQGVASDFPPKLTTDVEDGTMVAAWKANDQRVKARISTDGGFEWQDMVSLDVLPTLMELLAFPCGGSALITAEGNDLKLRFIDMNKKEFLDPIVLAKSPSPIKKIFVFRDYQKIRLFYQLENGDVYYLALLD